MQRWVFLLFLFPRPDVPKPNPLIPAGAWSAALKEHPRLLGPREHLQALARAKPSEYASVKSSQSLVAWGIRHAVEGLKPEQIEPFIRGAMKNVSRGVTNLHQDTWLMLHEGALVYDLFHEAIPAEKRQAIIEWMNGHLGKYTDDENAFHNSTLSKIACYLRVAYATWGENPRAREFRDHALGRLYEGKVVPVLQESGAGGGFPEGGWYTRGSLWNLVQGLELARRFERYDGFAKAPSFFYQRLAYEMLHPYPGKGPYGAERYAVEGDGADTYGAHMEYPRFTRMVLAQYFRGSELARFTAARDRAGSSHEIRVTDFLWREPLDPPADLQAFPLAHLASGIGRLYARGDWTGEATWFRFECGDFFANHQHLEVGNFEIFRREPLATESGEYQDYGSSHAVNWLMRTVAHNSLLVFQPDERFENYRNAGAKMANDGGQTARWGTVADTLQAWKGRREQFERGDIVAYDNRQSFLYVAADCTRAYSSSKLASWMRQIVFLRPHTFVIFDRVVSTRPEYEKAWLLHCRNAPEVKNRAVSIANGKGALHVQTLLPESPAIESVSGYRYRGQSYNAPRPGWRLEVKPSTPRTEDLFLHVLSTEGPVSATLVQEGSLFGAQVGPVKVLFDGKGSASLTAETRTFSLARTVRKGKYE